MTEVPEAFVKRRLRPPPGSANTVRLWIGVAIIAGTGFACWKMLRPWWRGESGQRADAYDRELAAARDRIGPGLDSLLDRLSSDARSVDLRAVITSDPALPASYSERGCDTGFDDAFALALGDRGLVQFSSLGTSHDATLQLVAKLSPSGVTYRLPGSDRPYPGIKMHAELELDDARLTVDVQPPDDLEFTHYRLAYDTSPLDEGEVTRGIVQATCREAAFSLIEAMTRWRRPLPARAVGERPE